MAPRSSRLPLIPFVPAFGVPSSLSLVLRVPWETCARSGRLAAAGLVVHDVDGRRHWLLNPDGPHRTHGPAAVD